MQERLLAKTVWPLAQETMSQGCQRSCFAQVACTCQCCPGPAKALAKGRSLMPLKIIILKPADIKPQSCNFSPLVAGVC